MILYFYGQFILKILQPGLEMQNLKNVLTVVYYTKLYFDQFMESKQGLIVIHPFWFINNKPIFIINKTSKINKSINLNTNLTDVK